MRRVKMEKTKHGNTQKKWMVRDTLGVCSVIKLAIGDV
jgi:hypothetical protein